MAKLAQKKKSRLPPPPLGNKRAVGNKGGHPTPYRQEYVDMVRQLCQLGATDVEVAHFFKVDVRTIYNWRIAHREFFQAMELGKAPANDRVIRSLYQRAVGYDYEERPGIKHIPGDVVAQKMWLYNRMSKDWRDRIEHIHETGPEMTAAEALEDLIAVLVKHGVQVALPPPTIDGECEETEGGK